ncbi:DUF2524 domain-containing protein [Paenibacillus humicola]|uniref:DUF2524 domain-containing protein n=1 Tax=Paenibacillus humicola TaxID=3110540 RepID=UPI00237A39D2|nr:DUF2524 domain-containing protein [Paenibacillus humicola]
MLNNLESSYDCSQASEDLHSLRLELESLISGSSERSPEEQEKINRIENQIRFIANKCGIEPHPS